MKPYPRRQFLVQSSQIAAASFAPAFLLKIAKEAGHTVHIFSKHLHWLSITEMATQAAALGFDGVDLTVRPGGHIEPARVKDELPRAADAIHKAGLKLQTITTAIESIASPFAMDTIKTASVLGVEYYRMGWINYQSGKSIEENLKQIEEQLKTLAEFNRQYNIRGAYQNHAGKSFGAALWDVWLVLKSIRSPYLGSQFDLRHAMVEGLHHWENGFDLLEPFINTLTIKDFHYNTNVTSEPLENVPLGEGLVPWGAFLKKIKEKKVSIPIILHCEYPLGGAENGARNLRTPAQQVLAAFQKDLKVLKNYLNK